MKQYTLYHQNLILACSFIMLFAQTACQEEERMNDNGEVHSITLSGSKSRMITRSGDESIYFNPGTIYRIYGVDSPENGNGYNWGTATLSKTKGVEPDNHASILFDEGETPSYTTNQHLDFFSVTVEKEDDKEAVDVADNISDSEGTPTIFWQVNEDGTMDDLMYSNNLKYAGSEDGILQLDFEHTLSCLTFEVLKQDESEDSEKKLESAKLKRIAIKNTHKEGSMNLVNGDWDLTSEENTAGYTRVFYAPSEALPIETSPTEILTDDKNGVREMLIFPNTADRTISIEVTFSGLETDEANGETTVEYPIYKMAQTGDTNDQSEAFLFERNHRYRLSILLLKDQIRVVAISPKMYDWIDVPTDNYLGQPITFGGLMWMDRNLGANTADCENDFYGSIGYYYQQGRNIPYILDVDKWLYMTEDNDEDDLSGTPIMTNRMWCYNKNEAKTVGAQMTANDVYPRAMFQHGAAAYWIAHGKTPTDLELERLKKAQTECIYTFDHKGDSVWGYHKGYVAEFKGGNSNILSNFFYIFNPGDEIVRNGVLDEETTHEFYKFGGNTYRWGVYDNRLMEGAWNDVEAQPCPKGWRLPEEKDLYSFMPRSQLNWSKTYPQKYTNKTEEAVYGKITSEDGMTYNVIYMLKNPLTSSAYRIRFQSHFAKRRNGNGYSKNKRYITISRYPADSEHNIDYYTSDERLQTEWLAPIETATFPCAGFIVPENLLRYGLDENLVSQGNTGDHYIDFRSFGWGSVLRTSTYPNNYNYAYGFYLATTDYMVSVASAHRRALGDQIRCVRDITVKE